MAHPVAPPSREWVRRMADLEAECGGISVGGIDTREKERAFPKKTLWERVRFAWMTGRRILEDGPVGAVVSALEVLDSDGIPAVRASWPASLEGKHQPWVAELPANLHPGERRK